MKSLKRLLPPALMLLAAACSDTNAPITEELTEPIMRTELNHLKWQSPATAEQFSAVAITEVGQAVLAPATPSILADGRQVPLESYRVSFVAVAGAEQTVRVNYAPSLGYSHPYFEFSLRKLSLYKRPDGSTINKGDQVAITITIDQEDLEVHLEPSGLRFNDAEPPSLKMWYTHANPDYNGDGVVNSSDKALEQSQLELWVQQTTVDPWYGLNAEQSLTDKWLRANLRHFSGYAVSW